MKSDDVNSGYRQGNPYAQQDNYYSSNGYQPQAPTYPQQTPYQPSGNGGQSNMGYNNSKGAYGDGYSARNDYEMNDYSSGGPQQGENPLNAFFAEVRECTRLMLTLYSAQR